eukprot:PITA_08304
MGLFLFVAASTSAVDVHEMSIDEYINFVNPPAVHKYQNKFGESILCVKFSDQISVKYARDNITRGLKEAPKLKPWTPNNSNFDSGEVNISKLGVQSECPKGTVENREIKREDVERAGSVSQFLGRGARKPVSGDGYSREYSTVRFGSPDDTIAGLSAEFNVWNPHLAEDARFTLSQFWFVHRTTTTESIEAGWMSDDYQNGCYDRDCPGYVALPDIVLPGALLSPVSEDGGNQIQIQLRLDYRVMPNVGPAWTLHYSGVPIGFWPASLFIGLNEGAMYGEFGGEVCFTTRRSGRRLTKTHMGSGQFPEAGFSHAAFVKSITIFGADNNEIHPQYETVGDKPECYRVQYMERDSPIWGKGILFGGPGGNNVRCVA